jgi:hypothetical protein
MKYAVEWAKVPLHTKIHKDRFKHSEVNARGDIQTAKRSYKPTFIFQNKECMLKNAVTYFKLHLGNDCWSKPRYGWQVSGLGFEPRWRFLLFLILLGGKGEMSPIVTSATNWPIVPAPNRWTWSIWWIENWQGKPKYSEKTGPSATLSITNPTWPNLGSNPGRRGEKAETNRLSYGMAPWRLLGHWMGEIRTVCLRSTKRDRNQRYNSESWGVFIMA